MPTSSHPEEAWACARQQQLWLASFPAEDSAAFIDTLIELASAYRTPNPPTLQSIYKAAEIEAAAAEIQQARLGAGNTNAPRRRRRRPRRRRPLRLRGLARQGVGRDHARAPADRARGHGALPLQDARARAAAAKEPEWSAARRAAGRDVVLHVHRAGLVPRGAAMRGLLLRRFIAHSPTATPRALLRQVVSQERSQKSASAGCSTSSRRSALPSA